MSIMPDSTIRKKPASLLRQHVQRRADLLGQIRLVGKLPDGSAFEEFAVERAVHVAEREQPEQLRGLRIVGGADVISAPVDATA